MHTYTHAHTHPHTYRVSRQDRDGRCPCKHKVLFVSTRVQLGRDMAAILGRWQTVSVSVPIGINTAPTLTPRHTLTTNIVTWPVKDTHPLFYKAAHMATL